MRVAAAVLWAASAAWGCKCPPAPKPEPCQRTRDIVFVAHVERTEPESWEAVRRQMLARVPDSSGLWRKEEWSREDLAAEAPYLLTQGERTGASAEELESRIEKKYMRRTAYLRVAEAFSGMDAAEVAMSIEANDCSVDFEAGRSYLVYAWRDNETDALTTDVCAGTREVEDAAEDLRYFRARKSGEAKGRVFGFVTRDPDDIRWAFRASSPVAGADIEVRSGERVMRATSDGQGRYEIGGLAAGEYEVRARLPGVPEPVMRTVVLTAAGCSMQNLLARRVGGVRGRVIGGPVGLQITARSREYTGTALKQPDGSFQFSLLPPGEYQLEVTGGHRVTVLVLDGEVAEGVEIRVR